MFGSEFLIIFDLFQEFCVLRLQQDFTALGAALQLELALHFELSVCYLRELHVHLLLI